MPGPAQDPVQLRTPADREHRWRLAELHLRESLNQPWQGDIAFAQPADETPARLEDLLGAPVMVQVQRDGSTQRQWHGVITSCERLPASGTWRRWRASIASRLALFDIGSRCCLRQAHDATEAVRSLIGSAPSERRCNVRLDLRSPPPRRDQFTQWAESDLAFCRRLLEHDGIALVHDGDGILLTDHPDGFPRLKPELPWLPPDDEAPPTIDPHRRPALRRWRRRLALMPAQTTVRDWNWRRPQQPIERGARVPGGGGADQREDGSAHRDGDEADRLATIRAEASRCAGATWTGEADHPALAAGSVLRINAPDEPDADGHWLLTAVEHHAAQDGAGGAATYRCLVDAWPASETWRPARVTPRPRIHGLIPGVIDGHAEAVYANLDGDGCYRVRPAFDPDGQATMPVRLISPYAGSDHGLHLPLHPGTEVLIAYIDGDPDRPVICGAVPNPEHPSVVTDGNRSTSVLRTAGGNQLILDDAVGREVWHEKATRDRRCEAAGDRDEKTGGNRTALVRGSDSVAVQGDASSMVARGSSETVGGAKALTVGGALQISVGGACNETVGGLLSAQVGGARVSVVAGADQTNIGGDSAHTVAGDQRETTVGARQVQARKLRLAAMDELVLSCGTASITLRKNGDVVIRGGSITVQGSGTVAVKGSKVAGN